MSTPKSQQKEAGTIFLDTALKIYNKTLDIAMKLPKRCTFHYSQYLSATAFDILNNVKRANSIYPLSNEEVQMRRNYFLTAYAATETLVTMSSVAKEKYGLSGNTMKEWMELLSIEKRTIRGVMKNDRNKYKNICHEYGYLPDENSGDDIKEQ